jgi:hypothetical protein
MRTVSAVRRVSPALRLNPVSVQAPSTGEVRLEGIAAWAPKIRGFYGFQ